MRGLEDSFDRILLDLIRDGARISTLSYLTDLPAAKLRIIWHKLHHTSPPNGRLPRERVFQKTWKQHVQASILAQILTGLSDLDRLAKVHVGYRVYCHALGPERPLYGVDRATLLLRMLEEGNARLVSCPECGGKVVTFGEFHCCYCHAISTCYCIVPDAGRPAVPKKAGQSAPPGEGASRFSHHS